jgi:hypothetical protein
MIVLRQTLRDLGDMLARLRGDYCENDFSPWYKDADEACEHFLLSVVHLRKKLGEDRYEKLLDMFEHARAHFDCGERHLGSWLMQDMVEIIDGKTPFAYPADQWRWGEPFPANEIVSTTKH